MDQKEYLSMTPEQRSQYHAQQGSLCNKFDPNECDPLCPHGEQHICGSSYGYCAWRDIMFTECK